jgi:Putative metal-binding motif
VVTPGSTRLLTLVVRNAPKGAKIVLRCKGDGCPINRPRRRTVRRNLRKVVLHRCAAASRRRAAAEHHRAADDRPHVHLRGRARRDTGGADRLPRAGQEEGAAMLTRAMLAINDRNARIRPGAREIKGNKVDENCDDEIVPLPPLAGSVSNAWVTDSAGTRNVTLMARTSRAGRGSGCAAPAPDATSA